MEKSLKIPEGLKAFLDLPQNGRYLSKEGNGDRAADALKSYVA